MIGIDYTKFGLTDELKIEQCEHISTSIEKVLEKNTLLGYFFNYENVQNLYTLLDITSTQTADNSDQDIVKRLDDLNKKITWEIIPPYTEFEIAVRCSLQKLDDLAQSDDQNKNELLLELIKKTNKLFNDGFIQMHLVDSAFRKDYFNLLNSVKRTLNEDTYIKVVTDNAAIRSLCSLSVENEKKFIKIYKTVKTKLEVSEKYYQRSKSFLDNKELRDFETQYLNVYKMMRSQNYDTIEEAIETIDMVDFRLSQTVKDKKSNINNNLRSQIDKIRPFIWLEDWDVLKSNIEKLIAESEEKGITAELNLDKFHLEQKKNLKKETILNFIKDLEIKKPYGYLEISKKAREFIDKEASLSQFVSFSERSAVKTPASASENQTSISIKGKKRNKTLIKYSIYGIILLASAITFVINSKLNSDYFDRKGEKYINVIEAMVSKIPDKTRIDPEIIRKRLLAPESDLKIISVDDKEIVIIYKGKTFKKALPAERAKQ
jgi:hypothetical protein